MFNLFGSGRNDENENHDNDYLDLDEFEAFTLRYTGSLDGEKESDSDEETGNTQSQLNQTITGTRTN